LVVEGRGELYAAPLLLRRWLQDRGEYRDVLGKPVPCHGRDKAMMPNGIERFAATAAARPGCRGLLIILDAETDAVCHKGPELLARARAVTVVRVEICLAEPKYEAWLVASAETLELPALEFDPDRDPVAAIRAALPVKYVKPTWQPRLSSRVDLTLAMSRSPSLARTVAKLDAMVRAL
jgi:hypothetical protein